MFTAFPKSSLSLLENRFPVPQFRGNLIFHPFCTLNINLTNGNVLPLPAVDTAMAMGAKIANDHDAVGRRQEEEKLSYPFCHEKWAENASSIGGDLSPLADDVTYFNEGRSNANFELLCGNSGSKQQQGTYIDYYFYYYYYYLFSIRARKKWKKR